MSNDLADDQVKLVSYAIVFTKPSRERVMPGGEGSRVITDNMTDEQFAAMIIAEYMKPEESGKRSRYYEVTQDPADAKYLKVYYGVRKRRPKEPPNTERRQSEALEKLRDRLAARKSC